MLRYAVSCSLEPMPYRAPVVLQGGLEANLDTAASLGYDGVEFHLKDPGRYDPAAIRKAADARGLVFGGVCTGMEYLENGLCLISDDETVRRAAIDRLKEYVDFCAVLDAMLVVGTMRGSIPDFARYDYYLNRLAEAVLELSEYAEKSGVLLVVENIARYISNYLLTVGETAAFVQSLGRSNVKVHLDTHSMNIEERSMTENLFPQPEALGYVHFTDSNRAYPGGGSIDFRPFVRGLVRMNWQGLTAMECQPLPDPQTCARNAIRYCKALETIVGIEEGA